MTASTTINRLVRNVIGTGPFTAAVTEIFQLIIASATRACGISIAASQMAGHKFKFRKARYCFALLAVVTLTPDRDASGAQPRWPLISPLQRQFSLDVPDLTSDSPLVLDILDSGGHPAYRLECHNGNYEGTTPITFSGEFHCALVAFGRSGFDGINLLAEADSEQQRSDWLNRGRFLKYQLSGRCRASQVYGPSRRFRLRRMELNIALTDLRWTKEPDDSGRLSRLTVEVQVRVDEGVTSGTAMKEPEGELDLMCR